MEFKEALAAAMDKLNHSIELKQCYSGIDKLGTIKVCVHPTPQCLEYDIELVAFGLEQGKWVETDRAKLVEFYSWKHNRDKWYVIAREHSVFRDPTIKQYLKLELPKVPAHVVHKAYGRWSQ